MSESNQRNIWVFGNPDKTEYGFPMPGDLTKYLQGDVFTIEHGRYRQTLIRDADIIVLSRDGLAYGHLEIDDRVVPNDVDRNAYPKVKQAYLVRSSTLYAKPIRLSDHSITGLSYGRQLSEDEFESLLKSAGGIREFGCGTPLPDPAIELNRVLREVRDRLGQSEFRDNLLNSYGGKCAISGCEVVEALEAAHIDPWSNSESQDASNGLLLRADLHTLFDRNLLGIEPETMTVHVAEVIRESEYGQFNGVDLRKPDSDVAIPCADALTRRWTAFLEKNGAS